jgi:hypothetical protein
MSTDHDITRIVRSWLRVDENESADRVLDAVLDQLDTTPQRRATRWPARRLVEMNNAMRLGVAAAVLAIAALLGYSYFVAPNIGGPGLVDPSPIPSPTPTPTQPPTAGVGGLDAGTYRIGGFTRSPFTVTVPGGWHREDNFIGSGDSTVAEDAFEENGVFMASWVVSHVYADSCGWDGTLRETTTVDELVTALTEQTGHETSGPTDTELGGRRATQFVFSVPASFDISACDQEFLRLWPDAGPDENYGLPIAVGQTATVYVIDFESGPMLVIAGSMEASSPRDVAELEAVIRSIRFEEP